MPRIDNVLYPVDYAEPAKVVLVDEGNRDFARLRQLIREAVPKGGVPLTDQQIVRSILDRREFAVSGIAQREMRAGVVEVIVERSANWKFAEAREAERE